jgi:hypothetical protein
MGDGLEKFKWWIGAVRTHNNKADPVKESALLPWAVLSGIRSKSTGEIALGAPERS